jgi:hypothetical protein
MIDSYGAVEGIIYRETDVFTENLPQCHFVYYKYQMT